MCPWLSGWYAGDLYWCMIPPRASPTSEKDLIGAITIPVAVIFLRGIASGNLVALHIIVNKYRLPDVIFVKGQTQSKSTLIKGYLIASIRKSCGFGMI